MGLMDGKKGLILNIANDRSIATHIANNVIKQGATCGFGFLPMENIEKSQRRVKKAMEENGFADAWLHPCDVARTSRSTTSSRRPRGSSGRSTSWCTRWRSRTGTI